MKEIVVYIVVGIVFVSVFAGIGFGGWYFTRWFNYKLSYQSMVKEQVEKALVEHVGKYHK